MTVQKYVVSFREVGKEDVDLVGGKGANLGEMVKIDLPVPDGFIVTAKAYIDFIAQNKLNQRIKKIIEKTDVFDNIELKQASSKIKKLIINGHIAPSLVREIHQAYFNLGVKTRLQKMTNAIRLPLVAVRSSATAEDLPTASFAGQQVTYLNVKGEATLVKKVQQCWASLWEARAIFYRQQQGFNHFKVGIAVPVQLMVQSAVSGVMFTINPVNNEKREIVTEAVYGLGETIVQGEITPDHYVVDKTNYKIISKEVVPQRKQLVLKNTTNKMVNVHQKLIKKAKLTDKQIVQLAKLGRKIERHYYFPQDIEWAIDGKEIFIVQTRPVTTTQIQNSKFLPAGRQGKIQNLDEKLKKLPLILSGIPASPGIASGQVQLIHSPKEINKIETGDVLVAAKTNPDFVPAMKKAVAIVTDSGGRTSHAAIVSRELGIPSVVGTKNATKKLKNNQEITVLGSLGNIYQGKIEVETATMLETAQPLLKTATKLYVNLAATDRLEQIAAQNLDGVGLLRAEFIIANIGYHPKKLIQEKKQNLFVDQLSQSVALTAKSFYPRPVVYRTTDFRTNEYRNLKGGKLFEPNEENPMLGYRGAFRYIHDQQTFALEIQMIKKVRNKYNLKNLYLMIPFVRTPNELLKIKKIVSAHGLRRSPSFQLWIMVEVPSTIILLDDFIDIGIDGISIGTNDLTQLLYGVDRDNENVSFYFDERMPAVKWALEKVIKTCQKRGITSSICGEAPSNYPELIELLVSWGITSISVNPDRIENTRELIYEAERKLITKRKQDHK